MNVTTPTANPGAGPRVRREATRWLVDLLDAGSDDPRRADFRCWMDADPQHAAAWDEAERLWRLSQAAARHPDLVAAAERAWRAPAGGLGGTLRNWLVPAFAVAAALVIVVGLVTYGWTALHAVQPSVRFATGTGQQRTIQLPDGSALLLDTDSAVLVRYARDARRVVLVRGRAEFRVRHDEQWPFVVAAGSGTVTDIGTTFQVGMEAHDQVSVVLLEGEVVVAATHSAARLTSGEALHFDRAGIVNGPYPADLPQALGWTSGEVVAHDWRLSRLLAEMNRYSDVKVEANGAGLRQIHVTGTFRAGDQATLVKVLEAGWPVRARQVSTTRIVLRRVPASAGGRSHPG